MKTKLLYLSGLLAALAFTISCTKMNDLHQPYLDEGEIIYSAKADSVHSFAGKNRALLEIFVGAQRVDKLRVFWKDKTDSTDIPVGNHVGSWKKPIENLPEGDYIFQIFSFDKFGNKSLPREVSEKVYGDLFQSRLANRRILSKSTLVNGKVTISWGSVVDNGIACKLVYKNLSGKQVSQTVPMTVTSTVITDLASDLKYRTMFLPEPTAIDTFFTDFVNVSF